jgi:hypothetical protein
MIKETLYQYLGTNGTLLTPIHLEGIYSVKKVKLTAEKGKRLTKDYNTFYNSIIVPEKEVGEWFEVEI